MRKTKDKGLKLTSLSSSILFLVAIIGGVLEAGSFWGGLAGLLFWFISSITVLLGFIPFIGPILYYYAASFEGSLITGLFGLNMPLTIGIILWVNTILAMLLCFLSSLLVIIALKGRK